MSDSEFSRPSVEGIEITGLLGRGATSRVYLGIQTRFDRPVAVKVLELEGREALAADLVLNETRVLAMLSSHPNILTLYDAGVTDDGHPFLMTEYLPAGSLGPRIRRSGPLPYSEVVRIGVQLCGALGTAHLHGVIHGDVKPDNVLIGRIQQPLLSDFGVAAIQSRSSRANPSVLTPLHAAPEMLGDAPASVASDIYALGSTLMALCTGFSPVGRASERTDVILGRLHDGVRVERGRDGVPAELLELLDRATARDPADRPDDMTEFGGLLQAFQVSCGETPTELAVMPEIPDPATPPQLEALGAPDAELTVPPTQQAVAGSPRLLRTSIGVAAAVVLVGVGGWAAFGGEAPRSSTDEQGVTVAADRDGLGGAPAEPDDVTGTTLDLPNSDLAGIQPGIQYGQPPGPDTSADLADKLAEEPVVFSKVPAVPAPAPLYGQVLNDLPATFHYQAFNSSMDDTFETCRGMMSRPITVTGLWERTAVWPTGAMSIAVAQTADSDMGHELATVISIGNGVDPEQCWGLARWNVVDYDDYGTERRDVDGLLQEGTVYNVWQYDGPEFGGRTWDQIIRLVMQIDEYAVDISIATDEVLLPSNENVIADIAKQVRSRLIDS